MSSLIGILVDVSVSMRNSAGDRVNEERGNWARSIFKVVDELIKHDVESSNQTFALALGSPKEPEVFDLLGTVRVATEGAHGIKDLSSRKQGTELIDEMMDILERNGAVRIRTWWEMDVLLKVLDKATAATMLYYLKRRPDFARRFVFECLPQECREVVIQPLNRLGQVQRRYGRMAFVSYTAEDLMGWAPESSVREAIEKGKQLLAEMRSERPNIKMVPVSKAAIMSVQSASEILHNSIGENDEEKVEARHIKDLSSRKQLTELIDEMMDILERNGAVRFRSWGRMDVLLKVLDKATAAAMLYYLQRIPDFARRFVFECLPQDCREVVVQPCKLSGKRGFGGMVLSYTAHDLVGWASESSVREAIEKGKQLLAEMRSERPNIKMVPVSKAAIMSVQSASEILHNSIGENDEEKVEARHIKDLSSRKQLTELIDEMMDILERNGAVRFRSWGRMDVLLKVLDKATAAAMLYYLQRIPDFARRFVFECLPQDCREVVVQPCKLSGKRGFGGMVLSYTAHDLVGWASESSVGEAMEKGKQLLAEIRSERTIRSVQSASDILHKSTGKKELDKKRVDELLEAVEPYIYGRTPLMQAMHHSVDLFSHSQFANQKKLLFILCDGEPTDGWDPPVQELSDLGVTIVSCFITREGLSEPRRLYSLLDESWEVPAKFMFNMSSIVTTQNLPKKKGWKIDIENNETRLFFQVNHPNVIKEVCEMTRKCVLTQDAL